MPRDLSSAHPKGDALLALGSGDARRAMAALKQAARSDPADWDTWALLADLAAERENWNAARRYVARALSCAPADRKRDLRAKLAFLQDVLEALQAAPDATGPAELLPLAESCAEQGFTRTAAVLAARAAQLAPDEAVTDYVNGLVAWRRGRLKEAKRLLRRALANDPDLVPARSRLAFLLLSEGRAVDALREYDAVLAVRSDFLPGLYNRGVCLMRLARLDDALAAFDRVIKLEPRHHMAWIAKAQVLAEQGLDAASKRCWTRAVRLNRGYAEAALLGEIEESAVSGFTYPERRAVSS